LKVVGLDHPFEKEVNDLDFKVFVYADHLGAQEEVVDEDSSIVRQVYDALHDPLLSHELAGISPISGLLELRGVHVWFNRAAVREGEVVLFLDRRQVHLGLLFVSIILFNLLQVLLGARPRRLLEDFLSIFLQLVEVTLVHAIGTDYVLASFTAIGEAFNLGSRGHLLLLGLSLLEGEGLASVLGWISRGRDSTEGAMPSVRSNNSTLDGRWISVRRRLWGSSGSLIVEATSVAVLGLSLEFVEPRLIDFLLLDGLVQLESDALVFDLLLLQLVLQVRNDLAEAELREISLLLRVQLQVLDVTVVDVVVIDLLQYLSNSFLLGHVSSKFSRCAVAVLDHVVHLGFRSLQVSGQLQHVSVLRDAFLFKISFVDVQVKEYLEEGLESDLGTFN